ncbi:MAG: phenylalanine--tRNA ligase subunit beta [Gemmatimonadaceae bacterium]|nr:phenylalanine--tRNA ligase subunit beta [Gemmatimonadaceae bacterium]NUR21169.1 phenylalanine--tRNA ligase subunit beta [Gemmatimonadaceae bacterium]
MNVSHEWLRALVPHSLTPQQVRDVLTMRVATVDELVPLREDLAPIVIGRVVQAARHPDSDHLWVTKVDAGGPEPLDVVCGAPNVREGALYPFAPTGTTMPGGLKIEKRKIRGQWSNGMLCSARELGLGENHEGILELDVDARPGTRFLAAVPAGDTRIVVDVLPNRPDLLSHLGIARELAAAIDAAVTLPRFDGAAPALPATVVGKAEARAGEVSVRVEDAELASRYMGAVVRGVKVAPSPEWLVERLRSVGVRSINNVVDATNYVLHEMGQPTHAFDLSKLGGGSVVVRAARKGETITTLDGATRTLDERITVIADGSRPQAVAGVMGGRDSEVTESTTDLFVEVAIFDPRRTRAARRALGLSTDASYRFERTIDPELPPAALERVVSLIVALAGGRVDAIADVQSAPRRPQPLTLRVARVRKLLGEAVPAADIRRVLGAIGFEVAPAPGTEMLVGEEELTVLPPSWRGDTVDEIDLVEEVARLVGYDRFPSDLRPARPSAVPDAPHWLLAGRLRDELVGLGLYEARPIPFVAGGEESDFVRVLNPIAENEAFLRRDLLDSLARRAEYNLTRMQGDVRLFEIGNAFSARKDTLPREELRVAALVMGARRPVHFTESKPPAYDEWDAKAIAERIVAMVYPNARTELAPAGGEVLWAILVAGKSVGRVTRVRLDAPVWAAPAFGVEVSLGVISSERVAQPGRNAPQRAATSEQRRHPAYRPIPTTPAVELDLALLVPEEMHAAIVEEVLRRGAGDLLERLVLFDEYRGKGVEAGMRSLAWRLTLRHPERTLRDKEVEGRREKLLKTLEHELGIRQRTA